MSQSYPWLKLPHREYLVSISYAALKPVERLAFLELTMIAHTQPNKSLPDNDSALAGWAKLSTKQWLKIKANVFSEWFLVDGFWLLPDWFNIESTTVSTSEDNNTDLTPKQKRNAERQKRYRERNANRNTVTPESVTRNADTVTQDVTSNATVTPSNVTHRNEMGGKGGDLDLDKEQEVKTKTPREASVCDARFDEFWIQYPRKENKQGALKAWKKIKPSEKLFEEIILAVAKQKSWQAFQNGYAPHAATWLNGNRWEDQAPINQPTNNHSQTLSGTSSLMEANRKAVAEAKIMLFGNGEAA